MINGVLGISMTVVWLIVFGILLFAEITSLGLTTIWFAGGALAAMIANLLGAGIPLQIVIFVVVSLLLLISLRPLATKYFNKDRAKTNIDDMIGQDAKVSKKIDNFNGEGEVIFRGIEWMARSTDDEVIEVDEKVTIKEVSGVKLIVGKN